MAKNLGARADAAPGGDTHSKNKWAILATILVMTFMTCLDSSIVTVALPVMQKELAVGLDEIQLVSSVYLVASCLFTLPFGFLGDRVGKVYVFQAGVVLFTVGSLLCGVSATLPALVASRVVQGVGCAAAMANNMGIITESFPARERGRAMGLVATAVALGMMCGPVFGGLIVSAFPWEGIFLVNIPVGAVSFAAGLQTLPHVHPTGDAPRLRLAQSARACFGNAAFNLNFATMLIAFVGIGASEFTLPFYFQDAHGFSAGVAGLLFMTLPAVNAVVGPLSGSVSDRIGGEVPTMVGLGLYSVALVLVGMLGEQSPVWQIVAFAGLMSMGTSIFQAPNNSLFMGSAPTEALGFAGSLSNLARSLGMAVGISAGSAVLYGQMSVAAGHAVTSYVAGRPDIFLYGYRCVFFGLAALVAVGFALTVCRFARSRR